MDGQKDRQHMLKTARRRLLIRSPPSFSFDLVTRLDVTGCQFSFKKGKIANWMDHSTCDSMN